MSTTATERLESLKRRHRELQDREIRLEAEVSGLTTKETELVSEMMDKFGVEDIDGLRALAEKMRAEDTGKLDAYEEALTSTEREFAALEAK